MISIEKVLFPGILAGCLFLVFVTSMISRPYTVLASSAQGEAQPALGSLNAAAAAVQGLPVVPMIAGQPDRSQEVQQAVINTPVPDAADEPLSAPNAAANVAAGNAGECTLSGSYPDSVRRWCELIETYAAQNGIEANLIAAVMLQESGGNPQAYSKSGAVGLMQVMPRDGLAAGFMCINGPCFADRPSTQELYDPEFNISYGTRMLAGLIRKHGNVRGALRAYGPMDMGYRYADIVLGIANRYQ